MSNNSFGEDKRMVMFKDYQNMARNFAIYPKDSVSSYAVMGLASEAGEVAGKVKKVIRDHKGIMTDSDREAIKSEIGDVLWYLAAICTDYGFDLGSVAVDNIAKLQSRLDRDAIKGDGDNR